MRFIRIICNGSINSFRQPEFHTYHKTLPLPPKTTVAGMLGSALGISPSQVNEEWLLNERFKMGIVGTNEGEAKDLWQIRKYKDSQIKDFQKGKVTAPYFTAVIVRELLYKSHFMLYLSFEKAEDYEFVKKALQSPKWALSLGREDELIKITSIEDMEFTSFKVEHPYRNTVIAGDIAEINYKLHLEPDVSGNLLKIAPKTVNLPVSFIIKPDSEVRNGNDYRKFTYISSLPVILDNEGYFDKELGNAFQIF